MKTQRLLLAVVAFLALVLPVSAQELTSITGQVKDSEGGVLPGALITAKNTQTGLTRTATSSSDGGFTISQMPPGVYEVTATLQGFAGYRISDLRLAVGKTVPLQITLRPGMEETLTITADREVIETTESDVSTVIPQELIEALPITERNAITLALLVPGVSAAPYFDPTKSRDNFDGVRFGASAGSENLVLVDGADNNDDVVGSILQFYPQDSIQEFEVITSRFKAEYGHTDGGVINMITKSGANQLNGGGYYLRRDDGLNSKSWVEDEANLPKAEFKQDILGAYLGGPIVQDRVHFFANLDYTDRAKPLTLFTNGLVPEIDAAGTAPQDFEQTLLVGKLTAQIGTSNHATLRYGFQDDEQLNATLLSVSSPEHGGATTNRYHTILAKNQTVIGGDKLNEVFYQYSTFKNSKGTAADGHEFERREVRAGRSFLGHNLNLPQETLQDKHQFVNNFSWRASAAGDHDLKAGVEYQRVDVGGFFSTGQPFAVFTYPSEAAWVSGANAATAQIFNGPLFFVGDSYNNIFSLFIQDDWKATERLTLNLGLRYDLETNDWTQQDRTFISSDPLFFGGQPETDKNNFGPRMGFAYDVEGSGKFVLRGGYGLYYQQIFWNSPIRNPFLEGQLSTNFVVQNPTFRPGDPFCQNADDRNTPGCIPFPSVPAPDPANFVGRSFTSADPRIRTPYTHSFSIGFGAEVARNLGLDVDFVHQRSDNQVYRTNIAGRASVNGLDTSSIGRPGPLNAQGAELRYSGLLLGVRKRFSELSLQASYTFGRGEGHTVRQTTGIIDDRTEFFDRNFGPVNAHRDHIFTGSVTYRLPWEVEIGGIVKLQSGFFFTAIDPARGDQDGDLGVGDTIADQAIGSRIGSGRRGEFKGDDFSQVDLRIGKVFTIDNRFRPRVFFEVFNLFNTKNEKPESVQTNVGSAAFGTSTGVAGQFRQAQVSVRFDF